MPVQVIEKMVDNHQISIVQFHAILGFKIKTRLYKLALPVLSSVIDLKSIKSGKQLMDTEVDLAKAFSTLAEVADEEQLLRLLLDLFKTTRVDGKELTEAYFNELFIANYNLMYKIAYEVVIANRFFDLGGIVGLIKNQTAPVSPEK